MAESRREELAEQVTWEATERAALSAKFNDIAGTIREEASKASESIRAEASMKSAEIEADQAVVQAKMLAERERLEEESKKMDAALAHRLDQERNLREAQADNLRKEAASAKERRSSLPSCTVSWSPRGLASAPQPSDDTSQQEVAPPGTWCSRHRGCVVSEG